MSLDTSVIAEYIDLAGPFHRQAEAVVDSVRVGSLIAVLAHPVLAETYYVTVKLYTRLGISEPHQRADHLIEWLYRAPNFDLAEPSLPQALEAGRIKARFNLALTDAYVLAAAKQYHGKALFRKVEREMGAQLSELRKAYDLIFLEDYAE